MIRTFILLAFLSLALPASAMADERDLIRTPVLGQKQDCSLLNECAKDDRVRQDVIGKTQELDNGFDKDGRGQRRTVSDNVLDQLSPASGR